MIWVARERKRAYQQEFLLQFVVNLSASGWLESVGIRDKARNAVERNA